MSDLYDTTKHNAYKLLTDLDRCPHGRHEGDVCAGYQPGRPSSGCQGGLSLGNPHVQTGQVIGYNLGGRPYAMPDRGERHDATAWITAGTAATEETPDA
jgi:hypothetical protein